MHSLPQPGYDLETVRAVAIAYRRERRAGWPDGPACEAAIEAFRAQNPEFEREPASTAAAQIIAWAARDHADWFWQGAGLPELR